jgi:hypothetical protein
MQPELLEPKCLLGSINQGHHSHCAAIWHHQQLLVMPDGGAVAVVALIDAAQETLRLKQFRLHRRPLSRP